MERYETFKLRQTQKPYRQFPVSRRRPAFFVSGNAF
jgi:hypothetical protein